MSSLISPHGGELKSLFLSTAEAEAEKKAAQDNKIWKLTHRQICDIELLLNGGFSPLEGFMSQADYEAVLENMHLTDGTLWPMPITLDVNDNFATSVSTGDTISLADPEGYLIATMEISDKWQPDKKHEAVKVFSTDDLPTLRSLTFTNTDSVATSI